MNSGKDRYLITGGAGFIGSYLVSDLVKAGKDVTVIDNLTGKGGVPFLNNNSRNIIGSICDASTWAQLKGENFGTLIHLAAQTSGEFSQKNPQKDLMDNCLGTIMACSESAGLGGKHFIYMSSSSVYGDACKGIVDEGTELLPSSIYGVNKLAGEFYVKQSCTKSKIRHTIFRLTNCFGPGENLDIDSKGMVSIFCNMAWREEKLTVKGSPMRYRNFIHVSDVIDAIKCAINKDAGSGTFIVSSGEKILVRELVEMICNSFGKNDDFKVEYEGETSGDTFGFHADISKIKDKLGWEPRISTREGVASYSSWIMDQDIPTGKFSHHPFLRFGSSFRSREN